MKTFFLVSLALVSSTVMAAPGHYVGWITDSKCGLKGASAAHKACAVSCLSKPGAVYIFILASDGKTVYTIDNPATLKGHEGELSRVTGVITGKTLHIVTYEGAKKPSKKGKK